MRGKSSQQRLECNKDSFFFPSRLISHPRESGERKETCCLRAREEFKQRTEERKISGPTDASVAGTHTCTRRGCGRVTKSRKRNKIPLLIKLQQEGKILAQQGQSLSPTGKDLTNERQTTKNKQQQKWHQSHWTRETRGANPSH